MSDTESVKGKKRKTTQEFPSSSGGEIQGSILGQAIQELEDIEVETPTALERILSMKQTGASDHDVGNQIVAFFTKYKFEIEWGQEPRVPPGKEQWSEWV